MADEVNMKFILQLISSLSRILQKIRKYFNGTTISTSLVLPAAGSHPAILALNLNDLEAAILKVFYFWDLCGTAINVLFFLHNYHCIFLDYTVASQNQDIWHYSSVK